MLCKFPAGGKGCSENGFRPAQGEWTESGVPIRQIPGKKGTAGNHSSGGQQYAAQEKGGRGLTTGKASLDLQDHRASKKSRVAEHTSSGASQAGTPT